MGQRVINNKFLSNKIVFLYVEFREIYSSILYAMKDHRFSAYNDALSAACVTVAATYLNHVVKNFICIIMYFM